MVITCAHCGHYPVSSLAANCPKCTNAPKGARFFIGWSIAAAVFHFVATFALAGIAFVAGMGSFTQDVSSEVSFWRGVQWLWTPLAMAAWDPYNMHNDSQLIGLAFVWSCFIGIVAGFLVPLHRRRKRQQFSRPKRPTTTPATAPE